MKQHWQVCQVLIASTCRWCGAEASPFIHEVGGVMKYTFQPYLWRTEPRSRMLALLVVCLTVLMHVTFVGERVNAQQTGPEPTFYFVWTATAQGFSDTTDSDGTRSVYSRRIVMTGSSIYREYANGSHDNFPLDLTVTDDQDQL